MSDKGAGSVRTDAGALFFFPLPKSEAGRGGLLSAKTPAPSSLPATDSSLGSEKKLLQALGRSPSTTGANASDSRPKAAGLSSERLLALAHSAGLPADAHTARAITALMAEGLRLSPSAIRSVRLAITRRDDPETASLAARALAVGLNPDDPLVDRILDLAQGSGDGSSDAEGDTGSPDNGQQGAGKQASQPSSCVSPAKTELPDQLLATALKAAYEQALKDESLKSFARPGPGGTGWLYAPFDLRPLGFDFYGFIRICYREDSAICERCVFDLRSGNDRRLLELSGSGQAFRARFHAGNEEERQAVEALGLCSADLEPDTQDLLGTGADERA